MDWMLVGFYKIFSFAFIKYTTIKNLFRDKYIKLVAIFKTTVLQTIVIYQSGYFYVA